MYGIGRGGKDIVVVTSGNAGEVRMRVRSKLGQEEERRIVFICAKPDSVEDLRKLRVHKAREVFILGEMQQYDHDAVAIEILKSIAQVCEQQGRNDLVCHTLIEYQTTHSLFQLSGIDDYIGSYIRFDSFNFYVNGI